MNKLGKYHVQRETITTDRTVAAPNHTAPTAPTHICAIDPPPTVSQWTAPGIIPNLFGSSLLLKCLSFFRCHRDYVCFVLCASIYLLPFMPLLLNCGDEGSIVYAAVRVIRGEMFARDFFEVMGPGSIYFLALFFKLFGISFWASRLCLFLTSLGIAILIYFLSRRILSQHRLVVCLILAATSFGLSWPSVTHHLLSNFFSLLAVACVVLWHEHYHAGLLAAAGVSTAIVALTHQPKGALLLLAIVLYLATLLDVHTRRYRAPCIYLIGFFSMSATALLFFWSGGAIRNLYYANILWPLSHYSAVNTVPYAQQLISAYWNRWNFRGGPFDPLRAVAAFFIMPNFMIAALPVILPLLAWRAGFHRLSGWRSASPLVALYSLCGCALWLSEIHRMDITHLQFGSLLLIVVAIYLLCQLHQRWSKFALTALAFISSTVALANVATVLVASRPVSTRVGTVTMLANDPLIPYLDTRISPGQEIFVYPYRPMDYFLLDARNPSRYSLLVYNYNTNAEFRDAIHSLEEKRPQYVIWNTRFEEDYGMYLPTSHRLDPHELIMENYLRTHYVLREFRNEYAILERQPHGQ